VSNDQLDRAIKDLAIANRILSHENVLDGYGHVSVRHPLKPDRFLQACSCPPGHVEPSDIMEFHLDGRPVDPNDARPPYSERFIHGAIYEARPDLHAAVHSHAEDVLPFSIANAPFYPVIHIASAMGKTVPVWDIADTFGDATSLLVVNMDQGRDMARCLGDGRLVLMRGHGFSAAARSLKELVKMSVYVPQNARVLLNALRIGTVKGLSQGEIDTRVLAPSSQPDSPDMRRSWAFWVKRAGCEHLMED
jgi:HCOMODA/2-hydroxy-3-carboxy-muconic semialdehyde decarboxylase